MKGKHASGKAALLIATAVLLSLAGCGLPDGQVAASGPEIGSARATTLLSREHHEFYDSNDSLFVTFWERYFGRGLVVMGIAKKSYFTIIEYGDVKLLPGEDDNPCFVGGKGVKPCWGEKISWTTSGKPDASYFGVYGWLWTPLIEYYIGKNKGTEVGSYTTSKGTYTLHVKHLDQENIKYPDGHSPFDQYNCDGPATSPINMAEHFAAWENLMGIKIQSPSYCVVSTEVWGFRGGDSAVTNITVDKNSLIAYPSQAFFTRSASSRTIKISCTKYWKLVSGTKPSWVTLSTDVGSQLVTDVVVRVARNRTGSARTANVKFCLTNSSSTVATLTIYQSP